MGTMEPKLKVFKYFRERVPRLKLCNPYIPECAVKPCEDFVEEHSRFKDLADYGISPRQRILISGDRGSFQSDIAEAVGTHLVNSFFTVDWGKLIEEPPEKVTAVLREILFDAGRLSSHLTLCIPRIDCIMRHIGDPDALEYFVHLLSTAYSGITIIGTAESSFGSREEAELAECCFQSIVYVPRPGRSEDMYAIVERFFAGAAWAAGINERTSDLKGVSDLVAGRYMKTYKHLTYEDFLEIWLKILRKATLSGRRDKIEEAAFDLLTQDQKDISDENNNGND